MLGKPQVLLNAVGDAPFRASDLQRLGISRRNLPHWVEKGFVERITRGVYRVAYADLSESSSFVAVSKRAPRSVLCLLSALRWHGLSVECPRAVWIMIRRHARTPHIDFVETEVVRASGLAFMHGVEHHVRSGVAMNVTSPAKTIADCFRYRRHVGHHVALQALGAFMQKFHRGGSIRYSMDSLARAAKADRVWPLMRPYIEAFLIGSSR